MNATCACELARPCQEMCSCAEPFMSGGCQRCATYGSQEQQLLAAEAIAAAFDKLNDLTTPGRYMILDLSQASITEAEGAQGAPRRFPALP